MRTFILLVCVVGASLTFLYPKTALPDSLQILIATSTDDSLRYTYYRKLIAHYAGKNVDSALYFGKKAAEIADASLSYERPNIYSILGYYATAKQDLEGASRYLYKALNLADQLNLPQHKPGIWLSLGNLEDSRENIQEADSFLHLALDGYSDLNDSLGILKCYNNIANHLAKNQQPDSSMSFHFKTLRLTRNLKREDLEFRSLTNIGVAYHYLAKEDKSQYKHALDYYKQALEIAQKLEHTYGLCFLGINVGSLMRDADSLAPAIPYLLTAIPYCEKSGNFEGVGSCNMVLTDIYEKLGDYKNALAHYKEYNIYEDSIQKQRYSKNILEVETQYQTQEKDLLLSKRQNLIYLISSIGLGLVLLGFLGFLIYRNRQIQQKKEAEITLHLQEAEAANLRELDQLKSRFFANISHEFRTPLTLILGPVKQLIKKYSKGELAQELSLVYKNGVRLNDLVSQLMDLSRLESGKMKLSLQSGDIIAFVRGLAHSFASMADLKEIQYNIDIPAQVLLTRFDPDKLQSIITNLLSNAFKYTLEEGEVTFVLKVHEAEKQLELSVTDNGMGIPKDKLPQIFERFYRVEGSELEGAGIGLALTKELVHLHGGEIIVESEEGKGSWFSVLLPVLEWEKTGEVWKDEIQSESPAIAIGKSPQKLPFVNSNKPHLLLVEDNPDVRAFIVGQLKEKYQITEADNGKKGWELLEKRLPDLIITDVMMPVMDGNVFTQKVKSQEISSHIPVIMLTAKGDKASKLEGLETGADDFLSKPFDAEELETRIRNLIEQRRKLREKFSEEGKLRPENVSANSMDESFLKRVMEKVEENIEDETFSIEAFGREVGMSRGNLHKKLKAMTGMSPSVFLRTMRLHRAKNLLEQDAGTVAEISYLTGFSSPAYFSKCFKDQFGIAPGEMKTGKA